MAFLLIARRSQKSVTLSTGDHRRNWTDRTGNDSSFDANMSGSKADSPGYQKVGRDPKSISDRDDKTCNSSLYMRKWLCYISGVIKSFRHKGWPGCSKRKPRAGYGLIWSNAVGVA